MEEISIIMPVYNAQDTIEKAIESVVNQDYTKWELLIINDGSTDKTEAICEDWLKKDNRIRYIKIQNSGVSTARNTGIKMAKGKYLMFIDSDDRYKHNMLSKMISVVNDTQLVVCNYTYLYNEVKKDNIEIQELEHKKIYDVINYMHYKHILKMLWNKIFIRDIVVKNDIKMCPDIDYGEDYIFIIEYLSKISRVKIISDCLYYYNVHGTGLSTKYRNDALQKRFYTLGLHKKFYEVKGFPLDYLYKQYILGAYAEFANIVDKEDKKNRTNRIKEILDSDMLQNNIKNCKVKSIKFNVLKIILMKRMTHIIVIIGSIIRFKKNKNDFYKSRRK